MTRKNSKGTRGGRTLSPEMLEEAAGTLKLLAHPHRLRIIELLEIGDDGMPVHEITVALGLPQATVSQHLGAMRQVGLLKSTRKSHEVWYRINDARSLTILDCIRGRAH